MTSEQEHYLLSKRDEAERNRLNEQHKLHIKVQGGHLLHPLIPKSDIKRIADIATGTGIWLDDVVEELAKSGNKHGLELVGFDITDAVFDNTNRSGHSRKIVVSDIHKGFPEEFWGTFDVVHARFLIVVITEPQWANAVSNVVKLLKPGGYFQWDDFDYQDRVEGGFPISKDGLTSTQEEGKLLWDFYQSQAWSLHLMDTLSNALKNEPVENERRTDYTLVAYWRPDIQPEIVEWHKAVIAALLFPALRRSGKVTDEAEFKTIKDEYNRKVDALAAEGTIVPMPVATLVAQRKTTPKA